MIASFYNHRIVPVVQDACGRIAIVAAKYLHQGTRAVVAGFFGLGHDRTLDMTLIAYDLDLLKGLDCDLK